MTTGPGGGHQHPGPREAEAGHGRMADAPQQIPARGWKDVAVRVKDEARDDGLTLIAAGVAFFSLLSLFPAIVAFVSLYGLVASPDDVASQIDGLASTMPEDARRLLSDQLTQVAGGSKAGLGVGLFMGVAIALWGASTAMSHLLVALSTVYDETETRGYVKLRVRAIVMTFAGMVFLALTVFLLTAAPALADRAGNEALSTAASVLRWPILMVLMLLAMSVLYRYSPDRDQPKWRWVSWGAALATILWIVASVGFSLYVSHFGSYNKTYGSMAAVIITMFWLYLTALCVLVGAEVNAELEHQTTKDSTHGPAEPRGYRDAYVADTVGVAASHDEGLEPADP